jgi:lipopolysaccharide biosynthesis glycosyltransferase
LLSAYQKAIYLDGDMICLADISELYNIDMKTNIIAAVRDQGVINYYYKKKRKSSHDENDEDYIDGITLLKQSHNYFNGGMQIFHIDEFKKKYKIDDCIKFSASKKWKWHDQDVLNILCEDAVYFLSPAWNFMHSESIFESAPEFVRNEYHHAKHSPKIIHFSFDKKPWKNVYAIPYFEMFWKYATRIPFIDVIIERMWKEGLIGYKTYQKNQEYVLKDIEGGHGGMRFIIKCIKAWLKRGK